ncbi:MAG: L-glyceraldehyde 3-phosphate reductase [Bacteroidales bacterium]|nr:MAG: L-glyceraldehyde 3-phosphate reductase [Bacteroidales bacterium]
MDYLASDNRYNDMVYRRCGNSGISLPAISLGLWHNFGAVDDFDNSQKILRRAFDLGITHFDLANNYGPPVGSAEETLGRMLEKDFRPYRDEMIISTKAGYLMWSGPYGEWASKKHLVASLNQSLKRFKLDYVDIFYSHRPDPNTPLEETMMALDLLVRQGKTLYIGISNYSAEQTEKAVLILKSLGTPCLIHQPRYSMFDRWVEKELFEVLEHNSVGSIAFSPLAQGLLTDRYLKGIPDGSRASKAHGFLCPKHITDEIMGKVEALNAIAQSRNQSLAQMAIAWLLRDSRVTSVLIGVSTQAQLENSVKSLSNLRFSADELITIDKILG